MRSGPQGQRAQPLQTFRGERFACPVGRQRGQRIKLFRVRQSTASPVVVAAHVQAALLTQTFDHFVWIGAVADHIPQVYGRIVCRSCGKASFQGRQVGMHVAQDQ